MQDDLDSGSAEAALRLLDGGDVDGGDLIAVVLPPKLRRRLERLAAPKGHAADDPLRELVRILASLESPPEEGGTVRLAPDLAVPAGTLSLWLFSFLYGPSLRQVVGGHSDSDGGWRFEVDETLLAHEGGFPGRVDLPEDASIEEDAGELDENYGRPLRLEVTITGASEPKRVFTWEPRHLGGLAAFARLSASRASSFHCASVTRGTGSISTQSPPASPRSHRMDRRSTGQRGARAQPGASNATGSPSGVCSMRSRNGQDRRNLAATPGSRKQLHIRSSNASSTTT